MNEQKQKIISEIKVELMEYYDDIKFKIDIDVQEALKAIKMSEINKRKQLLKINEAMIQIVNQCLESNMKKLKEHTFENDEIEINDKDLFKKELKMILFDKYCVYIHIRGLLNLTAYGYLKPYARKNLIGHLLVTDWHLTESQMTFIRTLDMFNFEVHTEPFDLLEAHDCEIFKIDSDLVALYHLIEVHLSENKCVDNILLAERKELREKLSRQENLIFSYQTLAEINLQNNCFEYLTNLVKFNIHFAREYVTFNQGAFNSLNKLVYLQIDFNKCEVDFEENLLKNLTNLETLILILQESDVTFNEGSLNGLHRLKKFQVENRNMAIELPNNIFAQTTNLESFRNTIFGFSKLNKDTFNGLTQLRVLDIYFYYNNAIEISPSSLSPLVNLRELNLIQIRIINIPYVKVRNGMIGPDVIDSSCELFFFGTYFETFKKFLDMSKLISNCNTIGIRCDNLLKYIEEIQHFEQLTVLKLFFCKTMFNNLVNDALKNLSHLKQLNLYLETDAKITKKFFTGLQNLETLVIDSVDGSLEINKNAFNELVKLKELYIDEAISTRLNKDLFSNLKSLEKICLRATRLKNVERNVFQNCKNLKTIEISIEKFDDKEFEKLSSSTDKLQEYLGLSSTNFVSFLPYMKRIL